MTLRSGFPSGFGGMLVIGTIDAFTEVVDWSKCRSPSRAKRRQEKGIKTRRRVLRKPACYQNGNRLFVNTALMQALRAATKEQA